MKWYQFGLRKFLLATLLVGLLLSEIRIVECRLPYHELDGGIWIDFRHLPVALGIRKRSNAFGGAWELDCRYGQIK